MIDADALWSALPLPALLIGADDGIEAMNPAAESFLNASEKSMIGHSVWEQVAVDAPLDAAIARSRADQVPLFINDVDVGTGSVKPRECNIQISPMGPEGRMLFLIQPRELADQVVRNSASKAAAQSAIGMGQMLAHEIKNPLAGITGAAQLLSMNLTNGDREMTDLIVEESRRIVTLLDQVEEFGNLTKPTRAPVNLHDALERARKSAAVSFGAHMTFVEDYDPSLPSTYADLDQLVQVFLNLIKNASEAASPLGGRIRLHTFYDNALRLRRSDGSQQTLPLQVEIEDDGPGLPPDIAGNVFDPFVSGKENGTGLGLALVSKIITDHDGCISLSSGPGKTTFRLSLPLAPKTSE